MGRAGPQIPGLPNHPASQKPSPGLEPEPSGPHPTRCPRPGGRGGAGAVTYLLGHQAGDAHGPPHPAFLGPGLQSPCPARLPRWGRHGGLGSPQLACPGPKGPASASPAPQQQPRPRLRPSRWRPGSQGSLWHEARVTGAGPRGWGHPGSERGQQPAWLRPPMVPWCRPRCQGAALCPLPAQQRQGTAVGTSAPPAGPSSSQVPTPAPPAPGSRAPPAGQRPPPPRPAAPGSRCSHSRGPCPSPSPRQPGLSPQINGLPDTPAPPVQCPASQSQTDTQRWSDRPATKEPGAQAHAVAHRPQHDSTRCGHRGRAAGRAPGEDERGRGGRG